MHNRKDTSIFVKPVAITVWIAVCVLAIMFENTPLGLCSGFVFLLTLSSYLWARASLKDVDFELSVDRIGMFPDQLFIVRRIVRNRKALPMLWADIREPCDPSDCAAPVADVVVEYEETVDPEKDPEKRYERMYTLSLIRWRQSVMFKDQWKANRRGIMEIENSLLSSGDGFGLCAEGVVFHNSGSRRIVVYPKLVPISVWSILNDMWDTRSENNGFLKDRTVIKSVRDYLPGDLSRDINMRLLARGQGLKTNVFETVTPDTIMFVLDTGSFRRSKPEVFEHSLSTLASLIDELTKHGIRISLMAPESKWFSEVCTQPSTHDNDKYKMFELLAAAAPDDKSFTSELPLPSDEPGRIYIVCADTCLLTVALGAFTFPEHKTQYLSAGDGVDSDLALRVRNLFDFERAV